MTESIFVSAKRDFEKALAEAKDQLSLAQIAFDRADTVLRAKKALVRDLERALTALPGVAPRGAPVNPESRISEVARWFRSEPGRVLSTQDIERLTREIFKTDAVSHKSIWHQVRNALRDLQRRVPPEVERFGRGLYRFPTQELLREAGAAIIRAEATIVGNKITEDAATPSASNVEDVATPSVPAQEP